MTHLSRTITATIATTLAAGALFAVQAINGANAGHHTPIEQALQGAERTDADRERDAGRKPAEVLAFYGIEPGMTVMEIGAGGGYYTAILDPLVGPEGKVYAQNNPRSVESFLKNSVEARFGPEGSLPNTVRYWKSSADWDLEDNSLDAVFIFLMYHHMHYNADEGEKMPEATKATLSKIYAALKPGGVLGIIEHRAAEGTSRAQSNDWHRTPAETSIADATSIGFVADGELDVLVNPDDDERNKWGDAGLRGETTRFVQRFRKPE